MGLTCLYTPNCCANTFKDSDEYKTVTSQLATLQNEVSSLKQAMQAIQASPGDRSHMMSSMDRAIMAPGMVAPSPAQSSVSGRQPSVGQVRTPGTYRGSTSASHIIGIAQNNVGIALPDPQQGANQAESQAHPASARADPILEYSRDEMIRLCELHDAEIGIMYPVLNMGTVTEHARNLATRFDALRNQHSAQFFNDDKTLELKMVMCCALVVEESGPSLKAQKLFDSMESTLNRKLLAEEAYISILPLLCIFAGYRFLTDDEGLAWRVIGQVCRLCLELGLHRSQVHQGIQDPIERQNALNSFWSAYVLDRRWAFNTGLPYVIQDADIDPKLEYPTQHPYLVSMISYSRLGAKVWALVEQRRTAFIDNDKPWVQDIERLDAEIIAWYGHVPPEVQIQDWHKEGHVNTTSSYNLQRLRVWTYLRKNQIRNWLHAPILHNTNSIMGAPHLAQVCVDVAKDTVAYLHHVNSTTDMIRKSQAFYSQFLVSALAIMFLASTQAPVQFSATCREDFYTGLSLIEDLSPHSHISKRLWRIVWSLRAYLDQIAPRHGSDAHSSAAMGMLGLARGERMDPSSIPYNYGGPGMPMGPGGPNDPSAMDQSQNGQRLQENLVNIFEQYVGYNGFQNMRHPEGTQTPEQIRFTMQDGFFGQIRDMF
ncbi:hypothetical protein NLG97_g9320 [Lecanicillium saksenae]|uniref:Uncharacterized protein n=1 Tax=Lecanicillium saksenae TaxID=468837 RepID=A0ACC1QGJ6_9HYPO|nr:hypothetical protein NLG97_g9320 [Lecanicillium saksenae]